MTDLTGPDPIGTLAADLLATASNAVGPQFESVSVRPGDEVAWDNCCDTGGQLWVRVIQVFPATPGLEFAPTVRPCPQMWSAQFGLGFVLCTPGPSESGAPPSDDALTDSARSITLIAQQLLVAVTCDWLHEPVRVEASIVLGPLGGCAGWEWVVNAGYSCACGNI